MRGYLTYFILLTSISWLVSWSLVLPIRAEDSSIDQSKYPVMVPDTGQVGCYDSRKEIPCPKAGEPFYGQDANYSINAPEYELKKQNGNEIIVDHITGLSWQRTPDTVQKIWSEAIDYTDQLELSGFTDWRLPTKIELLSILSYGKIPSPLLAPPAEQKKAPSDQQPPSAWTLTTRIFPSLSAKALRLDNKQGTISNKYEKKYVYAVRGPSLTLGKYQINKDGTVIDSMTGLMWQASEIRPKKWEQALSYCQQLELGGFKDWRLPTIKELSTLVDESRTNPSIDTTFFPATRSAAYWSSTTFSEHPSFAWYVRFDNGLEYNGGYKGRRYFVRAVRGGVIASSPAEPALIPRPVQEEKIQEILPEQPDISEKPKKQVLPEREEMDMLEPYPLDPDAQYDNSKPQKRDNRRPRKRDNVQR